MPRILIVDDEPSLRHVVGEHLRRAGHDVATVSNGLEALDEMREAAFDLVITDIIMPQMEGIETIRELRKQTPALKIIAMSGGGRFDDGDYYLRMAHLFGSDAVLAKPFSREQLLEAVTRVLKKE